MESPVRICFGAALVVNLLLLSSTIVCSSLPHDTNSTSVKDDRNTRYARINATNWVQRQNAKSPDTSLNELNPKDSVSEEHTEKNAKYKDRGRVRFNTLTKSSTASPLRRAKSTTEATKESLIIVTPTPEVKKPAQIIDSMRTYKRTKLPVIVSSSTTPMSIKAEATKTENSDEEYEDEEEEEEDEDNKSNEKYSSGKFFDNNFFTIPSYNDDFSSYKERESLDKKEKKKDYSGESFGAFSTFFPKETSYGSKDHEAYKSENFFNFDSDLTTPKNDFFDKKFKEISKSIESKLASIATKTPAPNVTNVHKIVKENVGLERLGNNTPTNKSTVFIKNTKEIRVLDNEEAGSANKELSDVQGTSIYYEMSVLSTETYAINHSNDDDCDNETLPSDPTVSTSAEEELASIKATQATLLPAPTKPAFPDPSPDISTQSSNYFPLSSIIPTVFNSPSPIPISTQNNISPTENTITVYSSSFSRNRSYSKRLNLDSSKDSPNSVTQRPQQSVVNQSNRQQTRRFHHTTPKSKPIWMAPRRNVTNRYVRPTNPTTIYSEHFNIKDRFSTIRPNIANKTTLTTVSSDIDPVLQSDISGIKKIVHSPSISDNSIPSLWKRGSTKYTTLAGTTPSDEAGVSELEIPPTLTAWALASLRSPPSMATAIVNATGSTQKSVDENELQKVGEVLEKTEVSTSSTTTASTTIMNNDIVSKKITEIDQNRLPWRPIYTTTSQKVDTIPDPKPTEVKYEKLPAESNISEKNSDESIKTTEKSNEIFSSPVKTTKPKPTWIPATEPEKSTVQSQEASEETIPPVDATKSTGFESITKLPAGITTPQDETIASSEQKSEIKTTEQSKLPTTTDYEITTIRFSYVPTEAVTESEESEPTETTTEYTWHPVVPTRTMMTTMEDRPITTYRPKYITTTEEVEEMTTIIPETPPSIEVSSQIIENITTKSLETTTTETPVPTTTEEQTTTPLSTTTPSSTTTPISTTTTTEMTTTTEFIEPTTEGIEETTMIVTKVVTEIVTEINTERQRPSTTEQSTTQAVQETSSEESDCTSEENSDSNEVITQELKTTTEEATTYKETSVDNTPEVETTSIKIEVVTEQSAKINEITTSEDETTVDSTTEFGTKSVNSLEDLGSFADMTTEAIPRVAGDDENGSGAAIAIAVSTIGVIALILLIGLLLVVRRRGRRGVYAQRCTPVSLDAYSLDSVSVGHRKGNHRLRASKRSYGNPAYDDEVTSHPMQYAALANFAMDVESMSAEFAEIPSVTVRPDEVPPGCEDKNRYSNVLPLPETRVPLKRIGNDPTTEYINANFVAGPGNIRNYYIACQAPLPNTVVDFWRMIWEQNSRLVVMLTEYMENGVEKCYEYLPPSEITDNKRTFGDFQIILKKREQHDKYAVSSVQLVNLATRTWREVTHLWYFWPAKGVPEDYDSVIDFLSEMRSYMKISQTAKEYDEEGVEVIYGDQNRSSFHNLSKLRSDDGGSGNGVNVYSPARAEEMLRRGNANNGTLGRMKAAAEVDGVRPCVVVCASGAGRSACLIAADVCARALCAAAADVPRVVRELRAQRPHSLSNRHHYIFLYKLLSEYGNKLMGGGVDTI